MGDDDSVSLSDPMGHAHTIITWRLERVDRPTNKSKGPGLLP